MPGHAMPLFDAPAQPTQLDVSATLLAMLRDGPLRDELESAARRRITYGLFRAGLSAPGRGVPAPAGRPRREDGVRPRHAVKR